MTCIGRLSISVPRRCEILGARRRNGPTDGTVLRYWWRHIHDDAVFLADQALDPTFPGLNASVAEGFFDLWGTPE